MTIPRFADGLRLVATRSAITCSRLFVAYTLDRANIIFRGYTVITVGTWNLENLFRPGDARPESATTYQGVMSLPEQPSVGQALGLRRS